MCGAKTGGPSLNGFVDLGKETVIQGFVVRDSEPVPAAYVRLLDSDGEFTAEVVTSATGQFRFFARPGEWTLRALSSAGTGESKVTAAQGQAVTAQVALSAKPASAKA
jgi:hypothetical protein